jgi:hypothetical protein
MEACRMSEPLDPLVEFGADKLEAVVRSIEDARAKKLAAEWTYGPSLSTWLGDDEPDDDDSSDWHIRGLVPRDVAFLIAGDPKTGKTMAVESMAIALATGAKDWCGFSIAERKRVLVMPREDAERTTKIRLWQFARGAGLRRPHDLERFLSIDPISPLDLGNAEHVAKLHKACERFDVVIIDSFATSHHGDENSNRDMSNVMGAARDLALQTNTAIGFIHHYNGKGGTEDKRSPIHRLRGASAIAGYARHVVGAERGSEKGQVVISVDGNFEYKPEPFVVRLVNAMHDNKRTLHYELVGDAKEVRGAADDKLIDEAIVAVLSRAGADGCAERDLRSAVAGHLKDSGQKPDGVRGTRVSMRANQLRLDAKIDREVGGKKRWRQL